jgi:hypothetical protein
LSFRLGCAHTRAAGTRPSSAVSVCLTNRLDLCGPFVRESICAGGLQLAVRSRGIPTNCSILLRKFTVLWWSNDSATWLRDVTGNAATRCCIADEVVGGLVCYVGLQTRCNPDLINLAMCCFISSLCRGLGIRPVVHIAVSICMVARLRCTDFSIRAVGYRPPARCYIMSAAYIACCSYITSRAPKALSRL